MQPRPQKPQMPPGGLWTGTIKCYPCKMMLNGRDQYKDHLKSKLHRNNASRGEPPAPMCVPSAATPSSEGLGY